MKEVRYDIKRCLCCGRFLNSSGDWISAVFESEGFYEVCLSYLSERRDDWRCNVLYCAPDKSRFSVSVVYGGVNSFVEWFRISDSECERCQDCGMMMSWHAKVIIKACKGHERPVRDIESKILSSKLAVTALSFVSSSGHIEYVFKTKQEAFRLVFYLKSAFPVRVSEINEVDSDNGENWLNYKIKCPAVWIDDLVCINECPFTLAVCNSASSGLGFIDPLSGNSVIMNTDEYWKKKIIPYVPRSYLHEFCIESICECSISIGRTKMCEIILSDSNGGIVHTKSQLGNVLQQGDVCVAYDLRTINGSIIIVSRGKIPDKCNIRTGITVIGSQLEEIEEENTVKDMLNSLL